MELRALTRVAELRECERVQCSVWGEPVPEVTAASFRAAQHAGALVAGAFAREALLGFVYSFPSFVNGRIGQHSHLLAVLPEARGRGVGQALKWFQRDWCLTRGVTHVTWTFDPAQAKNAKLNLEHLGAFVQDYEVDFYGTLGGNLNGDLPTDRLVAEWPLEAKHVRALAAGGKRTVVERPFHAGLVCDKKGEPEILPAREAWRVWLELPPQILPGTHFDHALRWRLALRKTVMPLLKNGYRITRFVAGGYVLEKTNN